jgi:hypothetical protein
MQRCSYRPDRNPKDCMAGEGWAGEPQRGDLTKPRLKAWVNGTQTDTMSPEGAEQPFSIPHVPLVVGDPVRVHAVVGLLMCGVGRGANAIAGTRISPFQGCGKNLGVI